jgi:GT2 family glycosyltransferase
MAGWQVAYLGSARIIHHGGKSSEQVNARRHIHFQESKLRYTRKFHGRAAASLLRLFLIANYVFQWGLESLKGILGSHPQMRRERASTYLEVLRSGLKVT